MISLFRNIYNKNNNNNNTFLHRISISHSHTLFCCCLHIKLNFSHVQIFFTDTPILSYAKCKSFFFLFLLCSLLCVYGCYWCCVCATWYLFQYYCYYYYYCCTAGEWSTLSLSLSHSLINWVCVFVCVLS